MTRSFEMFKTMDELNAYFGRPFIECLLCGKEYQALGNHIRIAHAWNCQEYKLHFGIPVTQRLVSARLHQKLSAAATKMMEARGTEWEVNFKERGRKHSNIGKTWVPVPAIARKLRQSAKKGAAASHEKFKGQSCSVACPECGASHEVTAWASFSKRGVLCADCLRVRINKRERNRPNKAERNVSKNVNRRARLANGEIIGSLAQEIYDYVSVQTEDVGIGEIIDAIWPRHPKIVRANFKKRVSDLLSAKRLVAIRPGVYRAGS